MHRRSFTPHRTADLQHGKGAKKFCHGRPKRYQRAVALMGWAVRRSHHLGDARAASIGKPPSGCQRHGREDNRRDHCGAPMKSVGEPQERLLRPFTTFGESNRNKAQHHSAENSG